MASVALTPADMTSDRILDEFRLLADDTRRFYEHQVKDLTATTNERLDALTQDIRSFRERNSKPPVLLGAPSAGPSRALVMEAKEVRDWLPGPKTHRSHVAFEVPFKLETKATITSVGGSQTAAFIAGPAQPALRVAELMFHIPVGSGSAVEWTKETAFTPNADIVAEDTRKPTTDLAFANVVTPFETVATITKASLQAISDTPQLQDWINRRLSYAVLLRQEQHLLNAPTVGLVANAQPLAPAYTPGAGGTALDTTAGAISQLQAQGFTVDGVVLNAADVAAMRSLKTTQGEYLWASPDSAIGTAAVWAVPLVISPSLTAGTFLVGAFSQGSVLFTREVLQVAIAFENEDDFVKNLCTIRAELRAALAVTVPASLVKGTLPAPALLQAPAAAKTK